MIRSATPTLQRRADLETLPVQASGRPAWNIKDPVAQRYYQLGAEEYWIFQQVDGVATLESIVKRFETRFMPQRLELSQLHSFLGSLHKEGLLVAGAPGQGQQLFELGKKRRRAERLSAWANPWAIRFRGADPDRFLAGLHTCLGWLFRWPAILIYCLLIVVATGILAAQAGTLHEQLSNINTFFHPRTWPLFVLAIGSAKVLHELAHGVACKHFGGESHELGVLVLLGVPCLYCNVSDAWMLPRRSHRVLISAAGMLVELGLAAIATILWRYSEPGMFNAFCLRMVFVCSVSTILFNGNPLLRYDGYYMLADWLGIPNLAQQASGVVRDLLLRLVLGIAPAQRAPLTLRRRLGLGFYGLASLAYRVLVMATLLWLTHQFLKPYGVHGVAYLMAGFLLVGAVRPIRRLADDVRQLRRRPGWRSGRAALGVVIVLAVIAGLLFVPLPYRVSAPVSIVPRDTHVVFVTMSGTLRSAVSPGQVVVPGDVLGMLEDKRLDAELTDLQSQRDRQAVHLQNLQRNRIDRPDLEVQIPAAVDILANLDERLARCRREQQELIIKAPIAGTVLPPKARRPPSDERQIAAWHGTPLDPVNRGAYLETGTPFCLLGNPRRMEATAVIAQADIDAVREGQAVEVRLDQFPGPAYDGRLVEFARLDLGELPPELVARGDLPGRSENGQTPKLPEAYYQARIELNTGSRPVLTGAIGTARISVAPRSLGKRFTAAVARLFNLEL